MGAHTAGAAGEDSQAGHARRERRSSRATFVMVMQTTDVGDCEDRATGWRVGCRNIVQAARVYS